MSDHENNQEDNIEDQASSEETSTDNDTISADDGGEGASDGIYVLESVVDPEYLSKVAKYVIDYYASHEDLKIDASHIENMSTAAVQTFVSINRYAKDNDKSLQWLSPTDSFIDSFNNLGLYSEMMQMEIANA
ncbi:MAG: STAS domain-containing protein [Pseudomonadota bacterium]